MTPRVDAVGTWYRSGTTAEDPPAVLPLWSGTATCSTLAILPLGQNEAQKKGKELSIQAERLKGCDKDVYVLIPPKPYQSGPPLDSTVTPTKLVHQKEAKELHRLE